MKAVGRNTATRVNVVAMTARPISSAASMAAWYGVFPILRCRAMFSTSTMASSTSIPTTRARARSEMMFRVNPAKYMTINAGMMERGRAVAEMTVALKSLKKNQTTTTASMPPSRRRCMDPL